jgi:hypothetical protein
MQHARLQRTQQRSNNNNNNNNNNKTIIHLSIMHNIISSLSAAPWSPVLPSSFV